MQVSVAAGEIYMLANLDGTAYSSLAADTTHQIMKQGIGLDAQLLTLAAPGTAGQSINYLIEATFSETDTTPVVLPYYNASNPSVAYSGPANAGTTNNTKRQGLVTLQAKAGTAATTGSQSTPSPDSGYVGLAVVTVAYGASSVTNSNISAYYAAPALPAGGIVGGAQQSAVAGGTSDAITANFTPAPTALVNGLTLIVRAGSANATTTPTFSPNGLTARTIVKGNGLALAAGDISGAGHWLEMQYDATLTAWVLQNPATGIATVSQKPGEICFFPAAAAPSGFIKANGALVSRTTYAALYAFAVASGNMAASDGVWVEGQFSPGDGSTTFRIPDMRGNFIRGFDDARGIDSGRTIGSLQTDAMQGHQHTYSYAAHSPARAGSTGDVPLTDTPTNTTAIVSDGTNGTPRTAAETRPRNIALLACIKY